MNPSTYKLFVDALVAFHFAFVAFVIVGGLLVLRWRRVMWLHLPAVAWGIWIELSGGICPLTPLENQLRLAAGRADYDGSFVDHYIMPVLYPDGLTRDLQFTIAGIIVLINGACYGYLLWRRWQAGRPAVELVMPDPPPAGFPVVVADTPTAAATGTDGAGAP